MNETIRQIRSRRSVRAYEDSPIPPQIKQAILDAAIQAPSAGNMNLYTILDITDPELKRALSESCDHQPFIAQAPMVLVFCADYYRWYHAFCRHVPQVRKPDMGDLLLANADALIAAQNAVVAAESFGVGSCYIGDITENFEFHQHLLKLPEYVVPACMLCFGYPTQQQLQREKPPRFAREDVVHENGYSREKGDEMERMLLQRQPLAPGDTMPQWLERFCQRKWNSPFSVEMSRSCRAMCQSWADGPEEAE